jgi:voltage-gated potassium channel
MRRWLYEQLDPAARTEGGLSPINRVVMAVIFVAVTVSVLETESTIVSRSPELFIVIDTIFGSLFTLEYLLRLWAIGENPRFSGLSGRLRYVITPIALIDLLALIPFFLTAGLHDAFLLRLVRLLRLLSLAKFGRYSRALQNLWTGITTRRYELLMSLFAAFIVMLITASVLHFAEASNSPESFGSIPRALWWGVATVTKVGYGGAYPVTEIGKIFAALFAIVAVGVVAMPTGILAAAFSDAFQRDRQRTDGQDAEEG